MKRTKILSIFLSMLFKTSPSYLFIVLLQKVVESAKLLVNIILPKYLIDALLINSDVNLILFWGLMIVMSNVIFYALSLLFERYVGYKNTYVSESMVALISEKIMNVEYSYLEDPYYLDMRERAMQGILYQDSIQGMIRHLGNILQHGITLIGLVFIILTLSPIFILILLVFVFISVFIQKRFLKSQMVFYQTIVPNNRKLNYYANLSYEKRFQKDIRLFQMRDLLVDRLMLFNQILTDEVYEFSKKRGFYEGLFTILSELQAVITYGYIGLRVISDRFGNLIGIGDFTMYVSSSINFTRSLIEFVNAYIGILQYISYLEPFVDFLNLSDARSKDRSDLIFDGTIKTIRFDHVSFHYPKSDKLVLDDISFEIMEGEKISVVGLNGAGKTTLIKLLCRLYEPISGSIYINDIDIQNYDYNSYVKAIAAVFQDYKLFAFSLEDNIACSNKLDEGKIMSLIHQVGLVKKLASLSKGIKSILAKEYDKEGTELSGGESQKVAIARALYKDASLIILDEPTSALDPLAEAEIYEHFNELVGDHTALYISHRMSSSVFCDRILVLDAGQIVSFDSHVALMKKQDSTYYKLFTSQAKNYEIS